MQIIKRECLKETQEVRRQLNIMCTISCSVQKNLEYIENVTSYIFESTIYLVHVSSNM